ncbi:hypothetical protein FRC03_006223 [Tulasnella sp. 419]|nr:hypothetical protein FRC03_006223 [Tulasnella sp. 419]
MDRRRGVSGKQRPATTEELHLWSQTFASLNNLARLQSGSIGTGNANLGETATKVNKWMSSLPQDEALQADSFETMKAMKVKLIGGLTDIKTASEKEASAIAETLEHLSALIALRKGPDERRTKRARMPSPSSGPGSPLLSSGASLNGMSTVSGTLSAGGRTSSVGPQSGPRDARGKREFLASQLPLRPGRKVAFRQPAQGAGSKSHDVGGADGEGETWILAVVKQSVGGTKTRYEVQDDDNEDGEPGKKYTTSVKNMLPLPDPEASPRDSSHPSHYEEYPPGTVVLGLYPDTSCFYRAVVVAGPKDPPTGSGRTVSSTKAPSYRLKFEDDDDQVRAVGIQWVVEAPP